MFTFIYLIVLQNAHTFSKKLLSSPVNNKQVQQARNRWVVWGGWSLPCSRDNQYSCKLRGMNIAVDANFVINVVDILSSSLNLERSNSRAQFDLFKRELTSFLEKCCRCTPTDRISTSDRIFEIEINPTINRSTIRRKSHFLRKITDYCYRESRTFFSEIHSLIQAKIESIQVEVGDLESIKSAVEVTRSLGSNDVSLIASAILKSNQIGPTFIITRDENLRNAVAETYHLGTINLRGRTLNTRRILALDTCSYTSYLHRCCELSNDEQVSIIRLVAKEDISRHIGDRKRRIKGHQIDCAFGELQKSMRIKEQRRE